MKGFTIKRWLLAWVILSTTIIGSYLPSNVAEAIDSRPNIVFLLLDDMNYGDDWSMPVLQSRVIAAGASINQTWVTTPLCCPSRSSILRGQYTHNHDVATNKYPDGGFRRFYEQGLEDSTLATWLQTAGYTTALFGKYLNDYPLGAPSTYIPPGWSEWFAHSGSTYYNYTLNENGVNVQYGSAESDYATDVLSLKVQGFLDRALSDDKPFFAYIAPTAPHNPAAVAPRHQGQFSDEQAPRAPSFNEADVSDKPLWIRELPLLTDADIAGIDDLYRNRLGSLLAVDEMLAVILDKLQAAGVLDNTYVIVTSDNGTLLGEHRLIAKGVVYSESSRVPLFIRGPGIASGINLDQTWLNIDFAPTIAGLATVNYPEFVDGLNQTGMLLRGVRAPARSFMVEVTKEVAAQLTIPAFDSLHTPKYFYIRYDATNEIELYDLLADPYLQQSIHTSAPQALINNLDMQLDGLKVCSGATCRRP